ncbi:hypothetical protein O1611_g132 [Lasiodiplodia mahajangana]|uniref:Uncharacterized protein n=1 Tax=Lasiodiplodia mahajangana TaxID=1108764 RepID=A0ACC2K1D8_9PEZI|nr:hypothetical protein O1611_g132 [Lasiodiplodia mahajangana]
MAKIACDSVFTIYLDFPQNLKPNEEFLLCGLSVVQGWQDVQSPTTEFKAEALLTAWERYENGKLVPSTKENTARFKAWPIVVGRRDPANNNSPIIPGTYLLVYGVCGDQMPSKISITYSWAHGRADYCTQEEIPNYPDHRRPDMRLAEYDFKIRARRFLQGLRAAAETGDEMDDSWEWKEIIDDYLAGTMPGLRPSWCSVIEPTCPEQSILLSR